MKSETNGKVELEAEDIHYGAKAHADFKEGRNPPSFVSDEGTWEKAKEAALKTYDLEDEAFWPSVVTIYKSMHGTIKGKKVDARMNELNAGTSEGVKKAWETRKAEAMGKSDEAENKSRTAESSGSKEDHVAAAGAHKEAAEHHEALAKEARGNGDRESAMDHGFYARQHRMSENHHDMKAKGEYLSMKSRAAIEASNPEGINQYTKGGVSSSASKLYKRVADGIGDDSTPEGAAYRSSSKAFASGDVGDHKAAANAHREAAENQSTGESEREHLQLANRHERLANGAEASPVAKGSKEDSSVKADRLSEVANRTGSPSDHAAAGSAHWKAGGDAAEKGDWAKYEHHVAMRQEHDKKAVALGARYSGVQGLRAGEFRGNQHTSSSDLASDYSTHANVATRLANKASREADDMDSHKAAANAHEMANGAHELAASKCMSAGDTDGCDYHKGKAAEHADKVAEHNGKAMNQAAVGAVVAREQRDSNGCVVLNCSARSASEVWTKIDPLADGTMMYMPAGMHTIKPSNNGEPVVVTVDVDAKAAELIERQRAALNAGGKKPFFSVQHDTEIAAFWPQRFYWAKKLDATGNMAEGIWVDGEWTRAGREAVQGKDFRTFSPTFFVDAIRDSTDKPAKIMCNTAARANMGALENDPAFQKMSPLWASSAVKKAVRSVVNLLREENPLMTLDDVRVLVCRRHNLSLSTQEVADALLKDEELEASNPEGVNQYTKGMRTGKSDEEGEGAHREAEAASKKAFETNDPGDHQKAGDLLKHVANNYSVGRQSSEQFTRAQQHLRLARSLNASGSNNFASGEVETAGAN